MNNAKINFIVDIAIFILFLAMIVSGYMMGGSHDGQRAEAFEHGRRAYHEQYGAAPFEQPATAATQSTPLPPSNSGHYWRGIHEGAAFLLIIAALLHLILHWRWITLRFKRSTRSDAK